MNILLKRLQKIPLTMAAIEAFLFQAAKLVVIDELRTDDWVYLAHLIAYRTTTRLNADDKERAMMARLMQRMEEEKNELDCMFN